MRTRGKPATRCAGQAAIESVISVIVGSLLLVAALGIWVWFDRNFMRREVVYQTGVDPLTGEDTRSGRLRAGRPDAGPPPAVDEWYIPPGYVPEKLDLFGTGDS